MMEEKSKGEVHEARRRATVKRTDRKAVLVACVIRWTRLLKD